MRALFSKPMLSIFWVGLFCAVVFGVLTFGGQGEGSKAEARAQGNGGPDGGFTPTATPTCGSAWAVEQSPNLGDVANKLVGVDSTPNGTVWAVGSAKTST
jgi:hypothetical protein